MRLLTRSKSLMLLYPVVQSHPCLHDAEAVPHSAVVGDLAKQFGSKVSYLVMSTTDVAAAPTGERMIYGKVLPAGAVLRSSQQGPVVSNHQGITKISFVEYKAMFGQGQG